MLKLFNMNNEAFLAHLRPLGLLGLASLTATLWNANNIMIFSFKFFTYGPSLLSLDMVMDLESILFFLSICWISISVFTYSFSYMAQEKYINRFMGLLFLFVMSMFLLVFSANFFFLIIGWDGLGVTSFLLVVYFQNKNSHNAGMLTILTNRLGDILIMTSIIFFLTNSESVFNAGISLQTAQPLSMLLLALAACTKSAQMPFSSWLPAAMAAPTPVSSLVHSSTLVTAGVYLILRLKDLPALTSPTTQSLMLLTGAATMVMAGLGGLLEDDFKKMVALSTLSQLGLLFCALGAGAYQLAFFHLLTHAYFKALLFMASGSMIHSSNDYQDIRTLSLPHSKSFWTSSIITVSNLSLMGLPFLSGFYSKDLLLEYSMSTNLGAPSSLLFIAGTSLTVLYSLRFLILSSSSKILPGPLKPHKDNDFRMFSSYDKLFCLAIAGGSILNYLYLSYAPTLLLSLEMKNSILCLILISALLSSTNTLKTSRTHLKWSLGMMLGLSLLAPNFLKSAIFWHLNLSDKLIEKTLIKTILLENLPTSMAPKTALTLRSMKSFWLILSLTPALLFNL